MCPEKKGMRLSIIYECNAMQIFKNPIFCVDTQEVDAEHHKAHAIRSNDVNHSIIFIKFNVSISMNIS